MSFACLLADFAINRHAANEGIAAKALLVAGHGWVELICKVLRGNHDLLVVGTHDPHGLRRVLLGSTARTLLGGQRRR